MLELIQLPNIDKQNRLWNRRLAGLLIAGLASLTYQSTLNAQQFTSTAKLGKASQPEVIQTGSLEVEFQRLANATSPPVVTALAGSRDGRYLAAAGDDHAIRIVDTSNGKTIQTVLGHTDWIQSLVFVYPAQADPESATVPDLYSAGHDGRVLRWKYSFPLEAEEVAIVPYAIRSISISAEKQLLAIGGFSKEVLLFDLDQGQYTQRLKCRTEDQRAVRFSPDGQRVLSGSREGEIRVWDSDSGEMLADYHPHRRRIYTASFSADGQCITSAAEDHRVVRYDCHRKQQVWSVNLRQAKIMSLCLINDDLIAVAGADNSIKLLDAQTETVVSELRGHQGSIRIMTPCGENLASGSFDTTVRVWQLPLMEQQRMQAGLPTSKTPIKIDQKTQIR